MFWKKINSVQGNSLLTKYYKAHTIVSYQKENCMIECLDKSGIANFYLRHAINFNFDASKNLISPINNFNHVVLLVKAGKAAIAFFENGLLQDHKVIRAYMVRKKQGKSQIKHLKTKGKSRAGSRVRLKETEEFFEQIHDRLNSYLSQYAVDQIAWACGMTLYPYLFGEKVKSPIVLENTNLYKIPFHPHDATFEELQRLNLALHHHYYHDFHEDEAAETEDQFPEEEDDW